MGFHPATCLSNLQNDTIAHTRCTHTHAHTLYICSILREMQHKLSLHAYKYTPTHDHVSVSCSVVKKQRYTWRQTQIHTCILLPTQTRDIWFAYSLVCETFSILCLVLTFAQGDLSLSFSLFLFFFHVFSEKLSQRKKTSTYIEWLEIMDRSEMCARSMLISSNGCSSFW